MPPHVGMITGSGAEWQGTPGVGEWVLGDTVGAQRQYIPRGHCMGQLNGALVSAQRKPHLGQVAHAWGPMQFK